MKYFKKWLTKLLVYAGIVVGLFTLVFNIRIWYGNEMYPSLHDGDLIISLRVYNCSNINNEDVVLYKNNGKLSYGRIVAQPNSTVNIKDNNLIVNGNNMSADGFYETESGNLDMPYSVPDNSYFILNDYRSEKNDSRNIGAVSKKDVKGVVIFVIRRRDF